MGDFSIGSITYLWVTEYSEFNLPAHRSSLILLDNTGAAVGNEVLQQGSRPDRQATVGATDRVIPAADIATLRGYYEDGDTVSFTDCDGVTRNVIVYEFESSRGQVALRSYSMTLKEVP